MAGNGASGWERTGRDIGDRGCGTEVCGAGVCRAARWDRRGWRHLHRGQCRCGSALISVQLFHSAEWKVVGSFCSVPVLQLHISAQTNHCTGVFPSPSPTEAVPNALLCGGPLVLTSGLWSSQELKLDNFSFRFQLCSANQILTSVRQK